MSSSKDPKSMAKALRRSLAERKIDLSHGECLELVAQQHGVADWNTLSARVEMAEPTGDNRTLPDGWFATGNTDTGAVYRLGLDETTPGVALIECRLQRDSGAFLSGDRFATLMQSIVADEYRGKKLRLTASLKTEDADFGTIWMRVDGPSGALLGFDNMMNRKADGALEGTAGWTERSIVVEVPQEAASIHYGFFLQGYGRAWARSFRLETVGHEVEITAPQKPSRETSYLGRPANLDFSQRASA